MRTNIIPEEKVQTSEKVLEEKEGEEEEGEEEEEKTREEKEENKLNDVNNVIYLMIVVNFIRKIQREKTLKG